GPLETVVHEVTGFLCPPTEEAFGAAIVRLARDPSEGEAMGREGRKRVQEKFSMESFTSTFDAILRDLASDSSSSSSSSSSRPAGTLSWWPWMRKASLFAVAFLVGLAGTTIFSGSDLPKQ
ncbi:unnamed protein product, partial [Ascophyllum nodosum]